MMAGMTSMTSTSPPSWRRRLWRAVAALYGAWMAYSWRAKNQPQDWGPRALSELLRALFNIVFRFYGIRSEAVMSPEAQAQEKCIVTVSPHGAFAVGHVFMSMPKLRLEPRFAHFRGRAGAASVLFKVPLLREFLLSLGVREATKATMDALIRDGCSIALNTGGIWEQVHTDETQEQLYLQSNLGFIRLAFRHGIPIVPSYAFGEGQLFRTYPNAFRKLREWIARRFRVGLPAVVPWLRFGTRHYFVLGKPVYTSSTPVLNPSDEQIQDVLERWRAALLEVFEQHARDYLPPEVAEKGLKIVVRGAHGDAGKRAAKNAVDAPSSAQNAIRSRL